MNKIVHENESDFLQQIRHRIYQQEYKLPTIPEASLRLMNLLANPDSSTEEMEKVISLDPVLAGQILKVANSCLSGAIIEVGTVKNAVIRLGRRQIRSIVLMTSLKASLIQGKTFLQPVQQIWKKSLACAFFARFLAKKIGEDGEELFTIGLLHNIGQLTLVPVLYEMLQYSQEMLTPRLLQTVFSIHEMEIGKKLLTQWKIAQKLVEVISLQSCPMEQILSSQINLSQQKLGVAFRMTLHLYNNLSPNETDKPLDLAQEMEFLKLSQSSLEEMILQFKNVLQEVENLV